MEALQNYFETNREWLAEAALLAVHLVVGTLLSGLTLGGLYFLYFLAGVLRLEKGSREYYQMREHIMTESLLRYGITILCIFTIHSLIVVFFDWGLHASVVGTFLCLLFLVGKEGVRVATARKVKAQ
jgi:hypothetical protein